MKRAVILHGTDGAPAHNWFPWLKEQLKAKGFDVWVPELPSNHTPNRLVYNNFLFDSGWDFSKNLIIGHSSGAVTILNLLEDNRCPIIQTGVLVGAWSQTGETELDREQFKDLFPPRGFNFKKIKEKSKRLVYIHSDDDPYCPLDQAKWLAAQSQSELVIIPGGQHFSIGLDPSYTEFPKLIQLLSERQLL